MRNLWCCIWGRKRDLVHNSTQSISPGIIKGEDGILRWVYEMNMWKNQTLVITVWKVLLLATFKPLPRAYWLRPDKAPTANSAM